MQLTGLKVSVYLELKNVAKKILGRNLCICPACDSNFKKFLPLPDEFLKLVRDNNYKYELEDAEMLNYEHYLCPVCYSTDRDRLIILFLKNFFFTEGKVLHIAPAISISKFIKFKTALKETTVDLYMKGVDHNLSITDLSIFPDEQFDHVICSHVLEHIEDDTLAINELFRVLKQGSISIFLVPINKKLSDTLKVEGDDDVSVRWKYYGQDDHVRFYSRKGFIDLLRNAGFEVSLFNPSILSLRLPIPLRHCGIASNSILYIASKK